MLDLKITVCHVADGEGRVLGERSVLSATPLTEDDGGLSLGDERGMQSRENCRNLGTERLRSDLVRMATNTGA